MGDQINLFWEEFDHFHSKTKAFGDRDHIWNSSDIQNGSSHMWHYRNSYRYTKLLGKLSCRVTSKILGIGSAERSWGDVKHLKTNKRSHLSADRVKKQATIFGNSCMKKAELKREYTIEDTKPFQFWNDEDFDKKLDIMTSVTTEEVTKQMRVFKSWEEEWESNVIYIKSPVGKAKLLDKYGGLSWYDCDNNQMVHSDKNELKWIRITRGKKGTGKSGGYHLIAYDDNYDKGSADCEDHCEPWAFSVDLRSCIAEYYENHPELGVKVLHLEKEDNDEGEMDCSITEVDDDKKKRRRDESKYL